MMKLNSIKTIREGLDLIYHESSSVGASTPDFSDGLTECIMAMDDIVHLLPFLIDTGAIEKQTLSNIVRCHIELQYLNANRDSSSDYDTFKIEAWKKVEEFARSAVKALT